MSEMIVTQGEVVRKYRKQIPAAHRANMDTRIMWLWNQRFGTVQTIYNESTDTLDKLACTMILQAIVESNVSSINLIFQRLEGGSLEDTVNADKEKEEETLTI